MWKTGAGGTGESSPQFIGGKRAEERTSCGVAVLSQAMSPQIFLAPRAQKERYRVLALVSFVPVEMPAVAAAASGEESEFFDPILETIGAGQGDEQSVKAPKDELTGD